MNTKAASKAFVAAPGEGERLDFAGWLRVSESQTGGASGIVELDGAMGPLPHVHHERDECFYVIEGLFTFVLGTEEVAAPAGSIVFVPRRTRHAFKPGQGARALAFSNPGGLPGGFFRELTAAFRLGRPEPEVRAELAGKYDSWPA